MCIARWIHFSQPASTLFFSSRRRDARAASPSSLTPSRTGLSTSGHFYFAFFTLPRDVSVAGRRAWVWTRARKKEEERERALKGIEWFTLMGIGAAFTPPDRRWGIYPREDQWLLGIIRVFYSLTFFLEGRCVRVRTVADFSI